MNQDQANQTHHRWNKLYKEQHQSRAFQGADLWLEQWLPLLDTARNGLGLELGCGSGIDTQFLVDHGYRMVAADFAIAGLQITHRFVPQARTICHNLEIALPFASNAFSVVIASLSLHYFSWKRTQAAIAEISTCLQSEGLFLMRVNATNDLNFGAGQGEEIEPSYFLARGRKKRFFSQADLAQLFSSGWQIISLKEAQTSRYGKVKMVWELVARKKP